MSDDFHDIGASWKVLSNCGEEHPKTNLMACKRAAILKAARGAFLRQGYEGTSMESIAAAAGVSIMTLYRHAESKDDLFVAIIVGVCDESKHREIQEVLLRPLSEILILTGVECQQRLAHPDTVALMRAVMAEAERFPSLGLCLSRVYRTLGRNRR